jgi:hypothetical protein
MSYPVEYNVVADLVDEMTGACIEWTDELLQEEIDARIELETCGGHALVVTLSRHAGYKVAVRRPSGRSSIHFDENAVYVVIGWIQQLNAPWTATVQAEDPEMNAHVTHVVLLIASTLIRLQLFDVHTSLIYSGAAPPV